MHDKTVQDNMTAPLLMNALKCIREESQTSSQLHAWKVHDELRDLLPVQVYQLH